MEPEKWWLEANFPSGKVTFQGRTEIFGGYIGVEKTVAHLSGQIITPYLRRLVTLNGGE